MGGRVEGDEKLADEEVQGVCKGRAMGNATEEDLLGMLCGLDFMRG